jgi:hypothetical protein
MRSYERGCLPISPCQPQSLVGQTPGSEHRFPQRGSKGSGSTCWGTGSSRRPRSDSPPLYLRWRRRRKRDLLARDPGTFFLSLIVVPSALPHKSPIQRRPARASATSNSKRPEMVSQAGAWSARSRWRCRRVCRCRSRRLGARSLAAVRGDGSQADLRGRHHRAVNGERDTDRGSLPRGPGDGACDPPLAGDADAGGRPPPTPSYGYSPQR